MIARLLLSCWALAYAPAAFAQDCPAPGGPGTVPIDAACSGPRGARVDLEVGAPVVCLGGCDPFSQLVWVPITNRGGADAVDATLGFTRTADGATVRSLTVPLVRAGTSGWYGPYTIREASYRLVPQPPGLHT
jgi:hypothetical protein